MKSILISIAAVLSTSVLIAQTVSPYGLRTTRLAAYQASVVRNPNMELLDLEKVVPGLVLDIRYATENNFMRKRMYTLAKAYARKPVAQALARVQAELKTEGLGLKIFDAYRPYSVTVAFYESYRDTTYVASPYRGSRHNRGCALDLTLIDLATGKELTMPTAFDSFEKAAWPSTPVADPVIRKNRDMLIRVMEKYGFRVNASEWWHFDFIGYRQYDVLNVSFEELENYGTDK
ncbi:MAG: M15 family metallopeptidase [Cyclobacteriaceae bacterium]|jgi:D-alanyl-D-alanine dipeptidase|nr:M15 family metallopeptidase [Cyclobacteriaceae bacterium]